MIKTIEEAKAEALTFVGDSHQGEQKIITKKPTKKKVFTFNIKNIGVPFMQLFINNKLYGSWIYEGTVWSFEN